MRRTVSDPPELRGYVYQRHLGVGGFSDVFLYEQQLPKRLVAVKVLIADGLTDTARRAFVDEANLMAQLSAHPNIVTIYHADVADGSRPYFVMEYCSGPNLGERYKREPLGVADTLRIGVRIASATATAHAAGILHRDIKPANVLTNDFGAPLLSDFGIASTLDEVLPEHGGVPGGPHESGEVTTGSQSVGMSVPWSPPEMFGSDPQPDVRSDVFALGATLHTLLAGHTPFEIPGRSNGTLDLVGRIERGAITPLERADVPRSLATVLARAMAPRRQDRYQSAVELARALQRVELELGYAPTPIEVPHLEVEPEAAPDAGSGGEGETRVRGVAVIDAQSVPAPAATPPAVEASDTRLRGVVEPTPAAVPEGTVLRPVASVPPSAVTEPVAPSDLISTAPPVAPVGRRPRLVVIIVAAVVAVLAIAVVLAVVLVPATQEAAPTPTGHGGGAAIDDSPTVPAPVAGAVTPTADRTGLVFTWTNPKAETGDSYRWALSAQPDAQTPVAQPTVTVSGLTPGAKTCIKVTTLRGGTLSAPTEMCGTP